MDILFVFKYRLSYIENVLYHSRIYSAKVISSTLMYLLFRSIPLMIVIIALYQSSPSFAHFIIFFGSPKPRLEGIRPFFGLLSAKCYWKLS